MKISKTNKSNNLYLIANCKVNECKKHYSKIADIYIKQIYGELKNGTFTNNAGNTTVKPGNTSTKLLLTVSSKNLLNYSELKTVTGIINKKLVSHKIDTLCVLPDIETIKKSITVNYIFVSYKENKDKFKEIDCKEETSKQAGENKQARTTEETGEQAGATEETAKFDNKEFEKTCKKLEKIKIDYIVKYLEKNGYTVKKTEKNKTVIHKNKQAGKKETETTKQETETKNKQAGENK